MLVILEAATVQPFLALLQVFMEAQGCGHYEECHLQKF